MYAYITGTIEYLGDGLIIVDNNGIGYSLNISNNCLSRIGVIGENVKIYTYLNVREDEISLYGFYSKEEKAMFLKLINISGIGPKLAISVLSGLDINNLASVIMSGDTKTLSTVKGLGKKTAERIILELRGSIEGLIEDTPSYIQSDNINDAILALVNLGFGRQEAYKAVAKESENTTETSELIAKALRSLYK